ncbi:MAG: hypothetical protein HC896_03975 [Bacteroidales bacterium]|nr:hypothetical protein [Bacteroidales bacterium]
MVVKDEKANLMVLEAAANGVVLTSMTDFLNRSKDKKGIPKIEAGRVKQKHLKMYLSAIQEYKKYLDLPYNQSF